MSKDISKSSKAEKGKREGAITVAIVGERSMRESHASKIYYHNIQLLSNPLLPDKKWVIDYRGQTRFSGLRRAKNERLKTELRSKC